MSYKIIRLYFDDPRKNKVIKTGLTLKQARAHCKSPETSSSTAKSAEAIRHTNKHGKWFDSYEKS